MTNKTRVTHLALDDRERTAAAIRAAQLDCTLTEYVAGLIRRDVDDAGIADILDVVGTGQEVDHD